MGKAAWICTGVAALALGAYVAGVGYMHTDSYKQRVQERMAQHGLQIEGLEVSWLGGLSAERAVLLGRQNQPLLNFSSVSLSNNLFGTFWLFPSDCKPQKVALVPTLRVAADGSCNAVDLLKDLSELATVSWPHFEMHLQQATRGSWQDSVLSCGITVSSTTFELDNVKDGAHTICSKLKIVFEQDESSAKLQYEALDLDLRPYLPALPPFWQSLAKELFFPCSEKGALELHGAAWKLQDSCKGQSFSLDTKGSNSTELGTVFTAILPESACQQLFPDLKQAQAVSLRLSVNLAVAAKPCRLAVSDHSPELRKALFAGPLSSIADLLKEDIWVFEQTEQGLKVGEELLSQEQLATLANDSKNLLETLLPYFAEKE